MFLAPNLELTDADEDRLRTLANELAKGIEDEADLLKRLGFTRADYDALAETRMFRQMLAQATSEWDGASNTQKRIKLKAAVNVEQALPSFYTAMTNPKEPLASRVKVLEVVSRIGQLGMQEAQMAGSGQFFKLEINLGSVSGIDRRETITIEGVTPRVTAPALPGIVQSSVWDGMEGEL